MSKKKPVSKKTKQAAPATPPAAKLEVPKDLQKRISAPVEEAKPYRCAGFSAEGVDHYIISAELKDRGTVRHPWSAEVKNQIKQNLNGLFTEEQMRDTLNKTVLEALGGGLHNAGPLDGGPYGRGPARILGL